MTDDILEPIPPGRYSGVLRSHTSPDFTQNGHYYFSYRVELVDFNNRPVFVAMAGSPDTLALLLHMDSELIGRVFEVEVSQRSKDDIVYNTARFIIK